MVDFLCPLLFAWRWLGSRKIPGLAALLMSRDLDLQLFRLGGPGRDWWCFLFLSWFSRGWSRCQNTSRNLSWVGGEAGTHSPLPFGEGGGVYLVDDPLGITGVAFVLLMRSHSLTPLGVVAARAKRMHIMQACM